MESVVHLNDATFEDFLEENKDVFVMFYAPCMYLLFLNFSFMSNVTKLETIGSKLRKTMIGLA